MMRRPTVLVALLTLAALVGGGVARAEVSARPRNDGRTDTMIMGDAGITDGIDPIPQVWQPFRDLPVDWVLNPGGAERGDGRPHVVYHRVTGYPIVVWSYNNGESFDIAVARWTGSGWSQIEFVTSTAVNELDPRAFIKGDGTLYITWWVETPTPRVEVTWRGPADDGWATPVWVTDITEPGLRPAVACFGNALWVAYERQPFESPVNSAEIALRRRNEDGLFVLQHIAESNYNDVLDPLLHVKPGVFWMDWRYSEDQFAYIEINDPGSNGPDIESWTDPSWIGVESIRRLIGQLVGVGTVPHEESPDGDPPTLP